MTASVKRRTLIHQMDCPECARLLAEHERLNEYTAAANQRLPQDATGLLPALEYQRLQESANEAWIDSACARLELEQHRRNHVKAD